MCLYFDSVVEYPACHTGLGATSSVKKVGLVFPKPFNQREHGIWDLSYSVGSVRKVEFPKLTINREFICVHDMIFRPS